MIRIEAEHRSNGLSYFTVKNDDKPAGSFSMSTADWNAQTGRTMAELAGEAAPKATRRARKTPSEQPPAE